MSRQMLRARKLLDTRWRTSVWLVAAITVGGFFVAAAFDGALFGWQFTATRAPRATHSSEPVRQQVHLRFQQGVIMLHAKQYEHAMTAFHRVLELDPALPEAHVNMGFALIGLERYRAARDFFESAIALRKEQVNAYYGLAVALDGVGDRPGAIGAMRAFVHLNGPDDPYHRKAQAALWEWEAELAAARPAQTR